MTKPQGYIVIALLAVSLLLFGSLKTLEIVKSSAVPKYEYKILRLTSEGHDRTGDGAAKFATVQVSATELSQLGDEGWELVGSFLEMETAYPNFGNEKYVTGLQANVRPQGAVLLFKRAKK